MDKISYKRNSDWNLVFCCWGHKLTTDLLAKLPWTMSYLHIWLDQRKQIINLRVLSVLKLTLTISKRSEISESIGCFWNSGIKAFFRRHLRKAQSCPYRYTGSGKSWYNYQHICRLVWHWKYDFVLRYAVRL